MTDKEKAALEALRAAIQEYSDMLDGKKYSYAVGKVSVTKAGARLWFDHLLRRANEAAGLPEETDRRVFLVTDIFREDAAWEIVSAESHEEAARKWAESLIGPFAFDVRVTLQRGEIQSFGVERKEGHGAVRVEKRSA